MALFFTVNMMKDIFNRVPLLTALGKPGITPTKSLQQQANTTYTTTQRDALPAGSKWEGRQIWNSTTKKPEWWNGTTWLTLA